MKKTFIFFITLVLGLSLVTIPLTAEAHHNKNYPNVKRSDGTTKWIVLYNPNGGGFMASVAIKVTTWINYGNSSTYSGWHELVWYAQTKTINNSFIQCGGTMNTREHIVYKEDNSYPTNYTIKSGGSYIGDPNYTYVTKHSGTWLFKPSYGGKTEAQGSFYPNPSKCFGGGTVDDNWEFKN